MKIFLSWSGTVSQQIAQELRAWLPLILPAVQPFVTTTDIDKGARWFGEISAELEQCNYGVVCLTRENLSSQWLAFEAGALSKQLSARVATVLFGVQHADVKPPLAMFQGTIFRESEFRQLITNINAAANVDQRREDAQLDTLFPMLWPKIEEPVSLILKTAAATAPAGPEPAPDYAAMVAELLGLARSQAALLASPERLLAPIVERLEIAAMEARYLPDLDRERYIKRPSAATRQQVRLAIAKVRERLAEGLPTDQASEYVYDQLRKSGVSPQTVSVDPAGPVHVNIGGYNISDTIKAPTED